MSDIVKDEIVLNDDELIEEFYDKIIANFLYVSLLAIRRKPMLRSKCCSQSSCR